MKLKPWLSIALINLVILGVFPLSVQLATITISTAQNSPDKRSSWQTYRIPNEFSIRYPSGWFIERTSNTSGAPRELVIITNQKPKLGGGKVDLNLIKTDIQIEPGAFETVVNQTLAAAKETEKLTRREQIKVSGREALRLWFSNPETDTIITLVRYNTNETIYMASFYQKKSSAIPIIQMIHGSFRVAVG